MQKEHAILLHNELMAAGIQASIITIDDPSEDGDLTSAVSTPIKPKAVKKVKSEIDELVKLKEIKERLGINKLKIYHKETNTVNIYY